MTYGILAAVASMGVNAGYGEHRWRSGPRGTGQKPDPPRPKTVKPPGAATYAIRRKRCPVCYASPGRLCSAVFGRVEHALIKGSQVHLDRLYAPKG